MAQVLSKFYQNPQRPPDAGEFLACSLNLFMIPISG